jgi:inorganic pyrophosphatase
LIIGELTGGGNLTSRINITYNHVWRTITIMPGSSFWQHLDALVATHPLIIDRPRGTHHPRFADFAYPYDYGHLSATTAGDGQGIDVWLGSITTRGATGIICTVDLQKHDSDMKLLIGCTQEEPQRIVTLHNDGEQAGILVLRLSHQSGR